MEANDTMRRSDGLTSVQDADALQLGFRRNAFQAAALLGGALLGGALLGGAAAWDVAGFFANARSQRWE